MGIQRASWPNSALACVLLLTLSACGSGGSTAALRPQPADQGAPAGVATALPPAIDHTASGITPYSRSGSNTYLKSPGAAKDGGALLLQGEPAGAGFGVYRFSVNGLARSVSVVLDARETTGGVWIGVANYARGTWQFSGPFTSSQDVALDPEHLFAPLENVFVAVVAEGGQTVRVSSVMLLADNQKLAPAFTDEARTAHLPVTLAFDASTSKDVGGNIVRYDWDLDGNGSFETSTLGTPSAEGAFTTAGDHQVGLRVTDDAGLSATLQRTVTVHVWENSAQDPDSTPNSGKYSSVATVGGRPAISYYDAVHGQLKYTRALDAAGSAWAAPVVVDTSGHNCGASNSLAVVGGFAGISYIDSTTQSLMFAGAVDSYGAAWAPPIPLDTVHSDSTLTSLAAVNGDPAISYQDGNSQLKFVRAQNPAGSVWAPPVVVDSTPSSGAYSSLAVVNGKPAIAFQRGTYGVYYARATDSNGQAWGAPVQVDWNGRFPALAAVAGQPLIAWFGEVNAATLKSSLRFSRPEDSNGSSWSGGGTVDDAVSANGPAVFRVVGGIAVLGYYDIIAGQLKFARATDTTGLEWQTPLVLDQGGTPTGTLSLTAVDGRTGISYCDNMQGGLRYIQMD